MSVKIEEQGTLLAYASLLFIIFNDVHHQASSAQLDLEIENKRQADADIMPAQRGLGTDRKRGLKGCNFYWLRGSL